MTNQEVMNIKSVDSL